MAGTNNPRWHPVSTIHVRESVKLNLSFTPTFMLGISGTTDEIATISMVSFSRHYKPFGAILAKELEEQDRHAGKAGKTTRRIKKRF